MAAFSLKTFRLLYMIWFLFLFFAAQYGYKDIVALLLDNNANTNHQDSDGRTALMLAGKKSWNIIFQYNQTIPFSK